MRSTQTALISIVSLVITSWIAAHAAPQIEIVSPRENAHFRDRVMCAAKVTGADSDGVYVTAVVTYPGGAVDRTTLMDNGFSGDESPGDLVFSREVTGFQVPGRYSIRAKVWSKEGEAWSEPVTFSYSSSRPLRADTDRGVPYYLYAIIPAFLLLVGGLVVLSRRRTGVETQADDQPQDGQVVTEVRRSRTIVEAVCSDLRSQMDSVLDSVRNISRGAVTSPDREREMSELRMKIRAMENEIEEWRSAAIEYMDALHRGAECYGPEDPRGAVCLRDADIFAKFCQARGLERIVPAKGDVVITGVHQIVGEEPSDVREGDIVRCVEWGYRSDEGNVRPAKVVISSGPEVSNPAVGGRQNEQIRNRD